MKKKNSCKEKLQGIIRLLMVFYLMKLDFTELDEPTFVLWNDNKGNIHDDPVTGVRYDGKELSIIVHDRDTNSTITLYEDDFALNEDWLCGIHSNIRETLDRNPKLKQKNPIKSGIAGKYLKSAGSYTDSGGYSEHTLLRTVVLAEYELTSLANTRIATLVDEVIELHRRLDDGHCPDNPPVKKLCENNECEKCKNLFYDKKRGKLLKQYSL